MYDRILVPTDGSDHAERATRHARSLAAGFDATLVVVSVVDLSGAAGPFDAGGVTEEFRERIESEARDAVDSVADPTDDVPVETDVVEGDPAETILSLTEAESIDLVAMGTRGRSGLRRFVTGSVTEHVVRESPVPVVTVHRTDDPADTAYDDVLVPTDGSEAAGVAVDHGIELARAHDATVHAVSVVDVGAAAGGAGGPGGADATATPELFEGLTENAEANVAAVAERARDAGVDATTEVREGVPRSDLLEYVDDAGIDFVVMGTHGRTGVDRLLLGSTTEHVIRRSPVPVLSVSPDVAGVGD